MIKNKNRRFDLIFATSNPPNHGVVKNLAITLFSFEHHYSPDDPHVRFFTKTTLTDLFISEGFEIESIGYLGRIKGLSKNICIVARKKKS